MVKEEFVQEKVEEIGRVERPDTSDIIVRMTTFRGIRYVDIRHYLKLNKFTGFSKKGIAIPEQDFPKLMEILKKINI